MSRLDDVCNCGSLKTRFMSHPLLGQLHRNSWNNSCPALLQVQLWWSLVCLRTVPDSIFLGQPLDLLPTIMCRNRFPQIIFGQLWNIFVRVSSPSVDVLIDLHRDFWSCLCVENLKFSCEISILLPTFISIRENIVIALTMAKRTDFVDRPAPVDSLRIATLGAKTIYRSRPIYKVSSFSHGKRYRNDLSDADKMLGHKN